MRNNWPSQSFAYVTLLGLVTLFFKSSSVGRRGPQTLPEPPWNEHVAVSSMAMTLSLFSVTNKVECFGCSVSQSIWISNLHLGPLWDEYAGRISRVDLPWRRAGISILWHPKPLSGNSEHSKRPWQGCRFAILVPTKMRSSSLSSQTVQSCLFEVIFGI